MISKELIKKTEKELKKINWNKPSKEEIEKIRELRKQLGLNYTSWQQHSDEIGYVKGIEQLPRTKCFECGYIGDFNSEIKTCPKCKSGEVLSTLINVLVDEDAYKEHTAKQIKEYKEKESD